MNWTKKQLEVCLPNLKLKENLRKIVILKFDVILFCVGLFVENPSPSSYKCKTGSSDCFYCSLKIQNCFQNLRKQIKAIVFTGSRNLSRQQVFLPRQKLFIIRLSENCICGAAARHRASTCVGKVICYGKSQEQRRY